MSHQSDHSQNFLINEDKSKTLHQHKFQNNLSSLLLNPQSAIRNPPANKNLIRYWDFVNFQNNQCSRNIFVGYKNTTAHERRLKICLLFQVCRLSVATAVLREQTGYLYT